MATMGDNVSAGYKTDGNACLSEHADCDDARLPWVATPPPDTNDGDACISEHADGDDSPPYDTKVGGGDADAYGSGLAASRRESEPLTVGDGTTRVRERGREHRRNAGACRASFSGTAVVDHGTGGRYDVPGGSDTDAAGLYIDATGWSASTLTVCEIASTGTTGKYEEAASNCEDAGDDDPCFHNCGIDMSGGNVLQVAAMQTRTDPVSMHKEGMPNRVPYAMIPLKEPRVQ